jgi:hypothetical protein
MPDSHRYTVTLTDSAHGTLPNVRVFYRDDDQAAMDFAERELRRHRNIHGRSARFDGWRLRKAVSGVFNGRLIAEVRPGYDSRTVRDERNDPSDLPPF